VQQYLKTNSLAAPNAGLNTAFGGGSTSTDHAGQDITGSSSLSKGSISGGYTYTVYGWNDNSGVNIQYYKIDTMVSMRIVFLNVTCRLNVYNVFRDMHGPVVIKLVAPHMLIQRVRMHP
jgi:opacity protein-like surface antigen